jgi:hypothetical protein
VSPLSGHAEYLGKESEELIPQVESSFAAIRRPLLAQLQKHRAFLADNIRCDVGAALALYGVRAELDDAESLAGVCRDARMAELDRLIGALESEDKSALRTLITGLVESMRSAIALCDRARGSGVALSSADLRIVVEGDTAFRLNRYLLEMIHRVLEPLQPKSLLDTRAKR